VFLKSLTLRGFKSFADKTVLEFEPGVTVVVGPNGSGKSNLVDAVAWVLGAQGPRTLRGGKMDDVIFAGTPDRPALGRAEVSLCIDNTAGLLPIEFSEVTITRTLFRAGDSEYQINGAPCRLLDIQELLSDSGIGNIYSDEILWGAGLRWDRMSDALTSEEVRRLYRSMMETLQDAVKHRGSSLADEQYVDLFGRPGEYQQFHNVYAREGLSCPRCRHVIVRERVSGRSTFYCSACQV
jgi:energy-coupling factor transporter ATP-binding protein EcfA2